MILIITNYYLFFALSFFTVVYVLYRSIEECYHFKHFLKIVFILIPYFLIGVMLSIFIILPAFNFIIDNNRINGVINTELFHTDPKIILHLLLGVFVPSNTFISGFNNIFETGQYPTREILMWSSSLNAILLLQTLFVIKRSMRFLTLGFFYL